MDAAKKLRAAPTCEGLTAGTVAAVARGVIRRSRPAFLERRGGPAKADSEWAEKFLKREEWRPLAPTSDRTVPDSQIANHARSSFSDLTDGPVVPPHMVFNLDEFCCLLGPNRKWSWHPASQRRTVAIRRTKEDFTCTVLSNAAGKLVKLQMGATALVHAQPEEEHPKIYQDHRSESQFQNAGTFGRLAVFIVNHIKSIRDVEGQDVPAIVIVGAAAQHK